MLIIKLLPFIYLFIYFWVYGGYYTFARITNEENFKKCNNKVKNLKRVSGVKNKILKLLCLQLDIKEREIEKYKIVKVRKKR